MTQFGSNGSEGMVTLDLPIHDGRMRGDLMADLNPATNTNHINGQLHYHIQNLQPHHIQGVYPNNINMYKDSSHLATGVDNNLQHSSQAIPHEIMTNEMHNFNSVDNIENPRLIASKTEVSLNNLTEFRMFMVITQVNLI